MTALSPLYLRTFAPLRRYLQASSPLGVSADFLCSSCGALVPGPPVRTALDALEAEVQAVEEEPTVDDCERLLRVCSSVSDATDVL